MQWLYLGRLRISNGLFIVTNITKFLQLKRFFSLSAISEQVYILVRDNGCTVMKPEVLHGALHQVRGQFAAENQTQRTFHVEIKLSSKYKYLEFYF